MIVDSWLDMCDYLYAGVYECGGDGEERCDGAVGGGAVQARAVRGGGAIPHAGRTPEPLAHAKSLHSHVHLYFLFIITHLLEILHDTLIRHVVIFVSCIKLM